MLGGKVRVDVAKRLAALIADNPVAEIHVIAHSLGTAVLHDSLALLYREHAGVSEDLPVLDVRLHKLASVWMIANVSRLVYTATGLADPLDSTVRPGANGCTNFLANIWHEFDPFTWFSRFNPPNDGSWIARQAFDHGYRSIETSSVRQLNTHDFSDFIENPAVAVPLFRRLVRLTPSETELAQVAEEYRRGDVPGALGQLRDSLRGVVVKDRATLAEVASAARHVREVIAGVIERSPALAS
jgi:pimeloyl-ACP methyl ester carboxylesterase